MASGGPNSGWSGFQAGGLPLFTAADALPMLWMLWRRYRGIRHGLGLGDLIVQLRGMTAVPRASGTTRRGLRGVLGAERKEKAIMAGEILRASRRRQEMAGSRDGQEWLAGEERG